MFLNGINTRLSIGSCYRYTLVCQYAFTKFIPFLARGHCLLYGKIGRCRS